VDRRLVHDELERTRTDLDALVFHGPRLVWLFDRVVTSLHRHLDRETDASLRRTMHLPVGWDPFFADRMSLAQVYHYGTQHYDSHRHQLTLDQPAG
jgi:hypothetical protein